MATAILVIIPIYLFLNYLYKIKDEVPIRNNFIKKLKSKLNKNSTHIITAIFLINILCY